MPVDIPPHWIASLIEAHRPISVGSAPQVRLDQVQPAQAQVPQVDIVVEVIGNLPLQVKLQDVARLLGKRQTTGSRYRQYPPTILELIRLVENNPARPRGRDWNSIGALSMRYDSAAMRVTVEYCIDHCDFDPGTGAFDPKRKMVSYSAPEQSVAARANKKLDDLKKYAEQ